MYAVARDEAATRRAANLYAIGADQQDKAFCAQGTHVLGSHRVGGL